MQRELHLHRIVLATASKYSVRGAQEYQDAPRVQEQQPVWDKGQKTSALEDFQNQVLISERQNGLGACSISAF